MRIDKKYKIEKACSKDPVRSHLQHPWLNQESGVLCATDGHKLAVVPIERHDNDVSGYVPCQAISAAKGNAIDCSDAYTVSVPFHGLKCERLAQSTPIPTPQNIKEHHFSKTPVFVTSLNAKSLHELADALGSKDGYVTLRFRHEQEGIEVLTSTEAYGLLMPCVTPPERKVS